MQLPQGGEPVSIDVMSAVWKHSEAKGNALLTMLAIADNSNDDGFAYPSYIHLSAKTRLSKRTAQNMVSQLLQTDELSLVTRGTQGRSNVYQINVESLRSKPAQMANPATSGGNPGGNPGGNHVATPTVSLPTVSTEPTASTAGAVDGEPGTLFTPPAPEVPPDETEAKIQKVWDHYFGHFGNKLAVKTLTPARVKTIRAALRAVDDDADTLCKAIDGFKKYREQRKKGSTSVDDIFKSRPGGSSLTELIEFWITQADDSPTMASSVPAILRERVSRHRLTIVESLTRPDDTVSQERAKEAAAWLLEHAKERPVIEGSQVVKWEPVG